MDALSIESRIRSELSDRRFALRLKVVRVVGIEPTLLSEPDFESGASTSFTTPAHSPPILAGALCTYTAPRAKTEYRQPFLLHSQTPENTTFSTRRDFLWIDRQTTF